ncbi:MAG: sulfatase-like hydrolase/transferase [Planctomycetota bacterium]|nr:sulfatase-like hydrolase/transferase [Planctomycetota bacterium]MDA1248084.1 sulfatase-like hydrolase/transferase [Planctomycetota bacterium]
MRHLTSLLILAAVATTSLAADKPNIILCMADDQGYGDVGYYGASPVKTPVLDEMARTALRFDRFYAAAPVCSPTRASVLTGRHPNRLACFSWGHSLRPQETTIAEALHNAGYLCGHFGKWHLGSTRADSPVCPGNSGFDEWLSAPNFYENDSLMSHNGKVIQTKGESSQLAVDFALNFMREAKRQDKPFLAVVWFGSPHSPHIAGKGFGELYADQPKAKREFLGELSGIDAAVGNLRKEIREMGIVDNTVLWYTSDNGALGVGSTAGLSGLKGSLLEGGLRVPTIIEWPSVITKPRITNRVSGTVDIYPTVLELAGVTMEKQPVLDGQSLLPLIRGGGDEPRRKPLGFWVYPAKGRSMQAGRMLAEQRDNPKPWHEVEPDPSQTGGYSTENLPGPSAWLDGDFKLHRIPATNGEAKFTLFNLKSDPAEKKDLASDHPDRVAKMSADLATWRKSVVSSLNGEDYR